MGKREILYDLTPEQREKLERNRLLRKRIHELAEMRSGEFIRALRSDKTVIFDLDNTLVDRRKTIGSYSKVFLNDFRCQLLATNTVEKISQILVEKDRCGYRGHLARSKDIAECSIWAESVHQQFLCEHWKYWVPHHTEPMEHLHEVLEEVSKIAVSCGLITNGSSSAQRAKIEKLRIKPYFDSIVISEEIGINKPDPGIFSYVIKELDVEPGNCFYIGDDPINDYDGALRFGMTPIWIRKGREWNLPYRPEYAIDSLSELPGLLRYVD